MNNKSKYCVTVLKRFFFVSGIFAFHFTHINIHTHTLTSFSQTSENELIECFVRHLKKTM